MNILWLILPVFGVVLVFAAAVIYTNVVCGVSLRAKLIELCLWMIHKALRPRRSTAELMKRRAEKNERPLRLPKLKSAVRETAVAGFPVYTVGEPCRGKKQAVLYLHGGAYVNQPTVFHWRFLDKLARETGLPITAAIYPKAPVHQVEEGYSFLYPV